LRGPMSRIRTETGGYWILESQDSPLRCATVAASPTSRRHRSTRKIEDRQHKLKQISLISLPFRRLLYCPMRPRMNIPRCPVALERSGMISACLHAVPLLSPASGG
jgi:hypothetical protein